jgi:hypothetical protein
MESYKNMFHKNPRQDHITSENITIGSKVYQNLVNEYGVHKTNAFNRGR